MMAHSRQPKSPASRFRVDDLEIDDGIRQVRRGTDILNLTRLSYNLLLALVRAAPNILTHQQLAEQVWGRRFVTPETITQRVKLVRDAIGDSPESPRYITLVRGEGYRLSAPVSYIDTPEQKRSGTGRHWIAAAFLTLILVLAWQVYQPRDDLHAPPPGETKPATAPSVAVLPFENIGPDTEYAYLSYGLAETMIHLLAQIPGLKVIARTSSFHFEDKDTRIAEVAYSLGVSHVLEGSIQASGDRIRVTAQLIDTTDSSHVWSRSLEREIEDIFAMQDEIAREVAAALRVSLVDESGGQRESLSLYQPSLEAFEQVVLGRHRMAKATAPSLAEAERHFSLAIELDPGYAAAYVGLAEVLDQLVYHGGLPLHESLERRRELIETALELDDQESGAYAVRGKLMFDYGQSDLAEADFLKSIELNPNNPRNRLYYAHKLLYELRSEEALIQLRLAAQFSPLDPLIQDKLTDALWAEGHPQEAIANIRHNIERMPDHPFFYWRLAGFLTDVGELGKAQYWMQAARKHNPGAASSWWMQCYGFLDLDDQPSARACVAELSKTYPDKLQSLYARYWLEIYLRDFDAAIATRREIISKAFDDRNSIRILADLLAGQGDIANAQDLLIGAFPQLLQPGLELAPSDLNPALVLAATYHAEGDIEQRERLLNAIEVELATTGSALIPIYVHALRDNRVAAMASVRAFFESGRRSGWWKLKNDWKLATLSSDPEMIALLAEVRADVKQQRLWYEEHKDHPLAATGDF